MRQPVVVLLAALAVLTGCGYALQGQGSFLPPDIQSIWIPPFESRTAPPELAELMRLAVIDELLSRAEVEVREDPPADAVLRGELIGYSVTPIEYGEEDRTTRAQVSIQVGAVLRRVEPETGDDGELVYENRAFSQRSEAELVEDSEVYYDPASDVAQELAERFARSLVASILEGF